MPNKRAPSLRRIWTLMLLVGGAAAAPADAEEFCTIHEQDYFAGETMACYSDRGCRFVASLGADPIRDFDAASAPYALARGKIAGIVTSSPEQLAKIKELRGRCRKL